MSEKFGYLAFHYRLTQFIVLFKAMYVSLISHYRIIVLNNVDFPNLALQTNTVSSNVGFSNHELSTSIMHDIVPTNVGFNNLGLLTGVMHNVLLFLTM